jgi:hypothetical protein
MTPSLLFFICRGTQLVWVAKTQSLSFGYKLWSNKLSCVTVCLIHRFIIHFDAWQIVLYFLLWSLLIKMCLFEWLFPGLKVLFEICPLYHTALNEALKKEVERLKIATGEIMSPSESFNLGMHHMPYTQSTFFPVPQQPGPACHQNMQLPFSHSQSSMSTHQLHQSNSHPFSEIMHNDPLGRLQGLDISGKGSSIVKSEVPSLSASESSTTFWHNLAAKLLTCWLVYGTPF